MTPPVTTSIEDRCEICNDTKDIVSHGFIVCQKCGTAKRKHYVSGLSQIHDRFGNDIRHTHPVNPLTNQVAGSHIMTSTTQRLPAKTVRKFQRLNRFYQRPSQFYGNSTHLRTLVAFTRIKQQMGLTNEIRDRTLYLYRIYSDRNVSITNHIVLIAVCLLQVIREKGDALPIRFSEVVSAFATNGHRVTNKNLLRLAEELDIDFSDTRRTAEHYISRVTADIRIDTTIRNRLQYRNVSPEEYEMRLNNIASHFLSKLTRKDRGGVQPFAFAVSVVYLADRAMAKALSRKPILTQKILANATNSAEFTIRDHVYRFLGELYKVNEDGLVKYINIQFLND